MSDNNVLNHYYFKASVFRFLLILLICISFTGVCLAQDSIVDKHGRLNVQGNRIYDQYGNPVVLRGMSLYWSQWKGQYYNADIVKWLSDDWNCTIVRAAMAVEAEGYLTNPEQEKQKIKTVVQAAIDNGLYVIIDWHDHNANKHVEQAKTFFEEMAKTYGNYPNVIYETWNEPLDEHDWSTVIKPYHEAVIAKIREHDPDNIIVCGSQTWSQDVDKAAKDRLKFDNIAYSLHFYAATHKKALRDKAMAALNNDIALMVTEWGSCEANGSGRLDEEETFRWFKFMDDNQLSWCNWSLADLEETSAALKPGASAEGGWSLDKLNPSGALVRKQLRIEHQHAMLDELKDMREPDVIYVPTKYQVVDKMLEMAQVKKDDIVYDLGCGDGRIVITAAKKYGCRGYGFDINPDRIRDSLKNVDANDIADLVTIEQKDIFTLDLSDVDVVTLYLLPSLNVKLIPQLEKLKPGSRIVSHDFDMRGVTPDEVVKVSPPGDREHTVYLWTTPLKKE